VIYLPKSIDYVVAIYATLVSGNTYVPIDASQPLERARLILAEAEPALVITESRFADSYVGESVQKLEMDRLEFSGASSTGVDDPEEFVGEWHCPDAMDIAAILFTSGSTGTPKGVQISHAMLNNFIEWTVADLALSHEDVFSNHASYAFDLSTFDLFASSRVGGAMWVITQSQQHHISELLKGLERFQVTIWYSVPTVLSMLVVSGEMSSCHTRQLRHVVFAGEPFPLGALRKLGECLPSGCHLSNWYGPTETNVCFAYRFSPAILSDLNSLSALPIGRPLSGFSAAVVDEQGKCLHTSGIQGELLVGGVGVTPGYCNFMDPHNQEHHRYGRHATGDLVHCDSSGLYYYHGRIDDLVKINGHRVELGEIETCLGQMPGVEEVVLIAELGEQHQKLIAYIVPESDEYQVNLISVKQFVSERLPRYMVPNAVRFLPSLPMNANGKVDRKYLRSLG
jgi:amino acid adenylation domain-containing protein